VTLEGSFGIAKMPKSIVVPVGNTTSRFSITTSVVAQEEVGNIQASLDGAIRIATLTVEPPTQSVVLSPSSVKGGDSSTLTVTIGSAAPPGGITIRLSSTSPINLSADYAEECAFVDVVAQSPV